MANTFKNYAEKDVTANQVIHTVAAATQTTIIGMTVANVTETAQTANVAIVTAGHANSYSIVKNATVPAGGALVPVGGDQKVVLEAGDSLTTHCSGKCDVILSVLEIT